MHFVSLEFFCFVIIIYTIYWSINSKYKLDFLLVSSILFYGTWNIYYTFHFLFLIIINYYLMEFYKKTKKDIFFNLSFFINIGNLAYYKYFYFLSENITQILNQNLFFENSINLFGPEIVLPLGISFYTFQIMGYNFDIKRKTYSMNHSLKEVILFISFFPQLIAGPILRASELFPSIQNLKNLKLDDLKIEKLKFGTWYILIGVFKKIFISDKLVLFIQNFKLVWANEVQFLEIWIICIAFICFLYNDFSAYSDIARGIGFYLGFEIPVNFKAPFFMHSFTDLFKRWHLSFSNWIRDYIFISLGGSRTSEWKIYRNLLITFSLGGLWHGASNSFLMWGFCMGMFLSIEVFLSKRGISDLPKNLFLRIFRIFIVWVLYLSSGIFFFAKDFTWGVQMIKKMFDFEIYPFGYLKLNDIYIILYAVFFTYFFQWLELNEMNFYKIRKKENFVLPVLILFLYILITQIENTKKDFFYFQF